MKKILLLVFALVCILKLNAQSPCGTDEYEAFMKRTNPQYAAQQQKMEQEIYSILKNKQNNPNSRIGANDCTTPTGVLTLPVVVHIIHKGESLGTGTNISDAQVIDAIRGLNERWRHVIGDGVDMEIQFALAVRDTNNNSTNGITRKDGSVFQKYVSNGVYSNNSSTGANLNEIDSSTAWDRSKYINIWVVDLKDAGGFASIGTNSYLYMGYTSMTYSSYALAHEMGHLFSLYHTFNGDGSSLATPSTQCPTNSDCLNNGDKICDTPPHRKEECNITICSTTGIVQNSTKNYMSYCSSSSTTRFTQGQKDRVRVLFSPDYPMFVDLLYSSSLIPINTPVEASIDISLQGGYKLFESLSIGNLCNGIIAPIIIVSNFGSQQINTLEGTYEIDGISRNFSINRTIVPGDSSWILLPQIQLQNMVFGDASFHNYTATIIKINGLSNDYNLYNNTKCNKIMARNADGEIIPRVYPPNACTFSNDSIVYNCLGSYNIITHPSSGYKFVGWYRDSINFFGQFLVDGFLTLDSILTLQFNPYGNCFNRICKPIAFYISLDTLVLTTNFPTGVINGYNTFSYGSNGYAVCGYKDTMVNETVNLIKGNNFIARGSTFIQAESTSCLTFSHWEKDGAYISSNNILNISPYTSSYLSFQAIFNNKRYNISLAANPTNGGTVSGAGNFACDSSLTVKAKIKTGYKFTNWTEGTTIVSTDSNYTFLITGARSLKANFSLLTGIKQTTINEISKVYPNPVSDVLQVEIRSKQSTNLTLNIIDIKGSLLESKIVSNTKGTINTSFDVSRLAKGNYILNLYDEEGMASYKFVVH